MGNNGDAPVEPMKLTSFRSRRKAPAISGEPDDFINLLHGSDPIRIELTRLENQLRDNDRELGEAYGEIKSLKYSERVKEKAVEELNDELKKVDEKLKKTEALLENKNLEIKKINDEKKSVLAAQFAAEATLRRVHAAQKDDEMPPIEAIITPLEAELKLSRLEMAKLQDDNKALDRLTKSKEAALLEAERTVQMALAKAALVDDLQNKNQDLMKQIEICQEENKILDKMHRLKVAEVEKLTQTVWELEEAVLAGGAAANAVREYQRKVQELNEEKRILDRELARAKISANRVAVVVANDWKDATDKVMPVKQWLEERKYYQGEMQQLKDKLAIAERAAKAEAQLKEKYQLRFKVLEERFKVPSNVTSRTAAEGRSISNVRSRRMSLGGVENLSRPSNGSLLRKTSFQSGSSQSNDASSLLKKAKNLSGAFDGGSRSEGKEKPVQLTDQKDNGHSGTSRESHSNGIVTAHENADLNAAEKMKLENKDYVSGAVYDMLQKEVIVLRKACNEKDHSLKDKDDAIEMLAKKVETLNKAMAIEAKRMRREVAAMEKEVATIRNGKEHDQRLKCSYTAKGAMNGHTLPQSVRKRKLRVSKLKCPEKRSELQKIYRTMMKEGSISYQKEYFSPRILSQLMSVCKVLSLRRSQNVLESNFEALSLKFT